MKKWLVTLLIVAALAALGSTAPRWAPPFLDFLGTNSTAIQTLSDLLQLILWGGAGTALVIKLWRSQKPDPRTLPEAGPARRVAAVSNSAAAIGGSVSGGHTPPGGDSIAGERAAIGGDSVGRERAELDRARPRRDPGEAALHQLPPPPTDFTGRTEELSDLTKNIGQGGVHISGLRGMGGVGKTALALKLAEQLTPCYPDAQFYLDLKGASPRPLSASDAMLHVVRAYDPTARPPDGEAELSARYRSLLHDQRAPLLMDNAASREQVEPLIPPACCVLIVTSRQHFTLPGIFDKDLDTLPPAEARTLLLKIAPRIGGQADAIAGLCGHLPLALRLAASALAERRDLATADYVRRLSDATQRLKLVDASLGLSYDLLGPDMQARWRTLAVFPETFDATAAAAVWQAEQDAAQDTLGELVRYSLLDWDEETARYRLHDLARLFADARLSAEERSAGRMRHAEHYLSVLREAKELYEQGGEGVRRGLALFDAEWRNVQAGQAWAAGQAGVNDRAAGLCSGYPDAGLYLLDLRQHPRERIGWREAGLAAARRIKDRGAEGVHLGNLGLAYAELGEVRRAVEFYEQDLVIAREIGDRRGEGIALWNMSLAFDKLGDRAQAIARAEAALKIHEEIEDPFTPTVREQLAEWRGEANRGGK